MDDNSTSVCCFVAGGLQVMKRVLKNGHKDEQSEALKVVLELVSSEENRMIIKVISNSRFSLGVFLCLFFLLLLPSFLF